jgi:hypothetical protein
MEIQATRSIALPTNVVAAQTAPPSGPVDGRGTSQISNLGVIPRPAGVGFGWSENALNDSATQFVKDNATGEDSKFGSMDGANCGLTAYVVPQEKAEALVSATKEMYPGSKEFQSLNYDPAQQRLVGVLVSEDEPRLFLCVQSKADGSCKISDDFSFVGSGASESLSAKTQEALVPAASGKDREDDWEFLSGALAGSKPLDLGSEAGSPFWWQ